MSGDKITALATFELKRLDDAFIEWRVTERDGQIALPAVKSNPPQR